MGEGNEGKVYAFFCLVGVALTMIGCGTGSKDCVQVGVVLAILGGFMTLPYIRIK